MKGGRFIRDPFFNISFLLLGREKDRHRGRSLRLVFCVGTLGDFQNDVHQDPVAV